jgi:hypothetical protein
MASVAHTPQQPPRACASGLRLCGLGLALNQHRAASRNCSVKGCSEVRTVEVGRGDDPKAGGFELQGRDRSAHSPGIGDATTAVDILHILKSVAGLATCVTLGPLSLDPIKNFKNVISQPSTPSTLQSPLLGPPNPPHQPSNLPFPYYYYYYFFLEKEKNE